MTDAERESFRQAALGCRARGECTVPRRPYTRSPEALQRIMDRRAERDRQVRETLARTERRREVERAMLAHVQRYIRLSSHKPGTMTTFCREHGIKRADFIRALRTYRLNSPFTRE